MHSRPVTLLGLVGFPLHAAAAGFVDSPGDSPLRAEDIIGAMQAPILGGRVMLNGFAISQSG